MQRFYFAIAYVACFAAVGISGEYSQQYLRLWKRYETDLSEPSVPPRSRQRLLFLPATQYESPNAEKANEYALGLIQMAREAMANDAAFAYQLLHESAYYGHDNLADKVVHGKQVPLKSKLATSSHPRLKWKRRAYYRVTSEHYQVVSRDERAGLEIAGRLESLYAVWRQLFLECWSNHQELEAAMDRGKTLVPRTHRLHRVVLFSSQQEYTEFLKKSQPRIGITKGFYDIAARTSYFFASPQRSNHSTQYHEATHQLFQEIQRASDRIALTKNFWAIEGIAMYMESLHYEGSTATVGGIGARRLQFARYRRLQEDFYVPLQELVTYGRNQIQQDDRIRRIYTQSAGLTHLLMDDEIGRHRAGFIRYLKGIYQGRDQVVSLSDSLRTDLVTLDNQYERFLRIDDNQLTAQDIPVDSLQSLCLGRTNVTNDGLRQLTQQTKLEWLDLAHTPVQMSGLAFIAQTKSLRQVSFDQCTLVDDEILKLISQNRELEELDLSATAITDDGLKQLAGLANLRTLWVSGTNLTDASLPILASLPALTTLGCEGTSLSQPGLEAMVAQKPKLNIE